MKNEIMLKPIYYASISGGKDSIYMLMKILENSQKYPLDYVVYFELENDFPFIKNVIDYYKKILEDNYNIKLLKFKPRKTFKELYDKYGYPNGVVRWCNDKYKLDCQKQLNEWCKSFGCYPIMYIGFCYDEEKRFKYEIGKYDIKNCKYVYPLAEEHIYESEILEWAKNESIFNDYYKYNKRCGCMGCPLTSMINWAYLKKYYPKYFENVMYLMKNDGIKSNEERANHIEKMLLKKWDKILDAKQN